MRARLEQNAIHDAWHVTDNTAARLGGSGMMCMGADIVCELDVALEAHPVRIVGKFQRCRIGGSSRRMRLMTLSAMRLPLAEARRAPECFHDECRFAKPAVFVEGAPRHVAIRLAQVSREKRSSLCRVIHLALRPRLMKGGLRVTLTANRDVLAR